MNPVKLAICDPYHRGSHKQFAETVAEMCQQDGFEVELLTLRGKHWKWRMQGAAAWFSEHLAASSPDVILTTDMVDVSRLRGLLPAALRNTRIIQYFHENQLTFPWPDHDPDLEQRIDRTYGMTNVMSALAADEVWFNSQFHRQTFLEAAAQIVEEMPDGKFSLERLKSSQVRYLPVNLERFGNLTADQIHRPLHKPLRIVWNHRWTMDKGADRFVVLLNALQAQGIQFELALMGLGLDSSQWNLEMKAFTDQIRFRQPAASPSEYSHWLTWADVMFHDPRQEFFGVSVVEAMHHGVLPIVPHWGPYKELLSGIEIPSKNDNDVTLLMFTLSHMDISRLRMRLSMRASEFCHTSQHELWTNSIASGL